MWSVVLEEKDWFICQHSDCSGMTSSITKNEDKSHRTPVLISDVCKFPHLITPYRVIFGACIVEPAFFLYDDRTKEHNRQSNIKPVKSKAFCKTDDCQRETNSIIAEIFSPETVYMLIDHRYYSYTYRNHLHKTEKRLLTADRLAYQHFK